MPISGLQPGQRLSRPQDRRASGGLVPRSFEERHRLRSTLAGPRALAYRHQLPQHRRHVLLPVLGFVLGPIAFILAIVGLVKNPKVHGTGHAIAGIILGLIDPVLWNTVFENATKG